MWRVVCPLGSQLTVDRLWVHRECWPLSSCPRPAEPNIHKTQSLLTDLLRRWTNNHPVHESQLGTTQRMSGLTAANAPTWRKRRSREWWRDYPMHSLCWGRTSGWTSRDKTSSRVKEGKLRGHSKWSFYNFASSKPYDPNKKRSNKLWKRNQAQEHSDD